MSNEVANEIRTQIIDDVRLYGASNAFGTGNSIFKTAVRLLKERGLGDLETIITQAKYVYDSFVAPIDIPWIPNFVEPIVDASIWKGLEAAIRAVASRMNVKTGSFDEVTE